MLEGNRADLAREQPRPRVQRLQARVLHLVVAEHLLHQQQRIRPHVYGARAVALRPLERGDEAAVLGDVVRRDADRFSELLDERAVRPLDAHAVAGRPRVAARAAVDVRDDRRLRRRREREHGYDAARGEASEAAADAAAGAAK